MMNVMINNNFNVNVNVDSNSNSLVNLQQNYIERLSNNPVGNKRLDANNNSHSFSSFVGQEIPGNMFQLDDMNMNGTNANERNTNTNTGNSNMNSNMNMNMNNNNNYIGSSTTTTTTEDKNKMLLKDFRRRSKNSLIFKETVANFWMLPAAERADQSTLTSSGTPGVAASTTTNTSAIVTSSPLKDNQNANNLVCQRSSSEFSGMFHPIEIISGRKINMNTNNSNASSNIHPPNGSPNATMNFRANPTNTEPMRVQIQRQSQRQTQTQSSSTSRNTGPLVTPSVMFGIDKLLLQSSSRIVNNTNKNCTTCYSSSNTNANSNSNTNTLRRSSVSDLLTPNAIPSAMVSNLPKSNGVLHGNASFSTRSILNCATSIVGCNNLNDLSSLYAHSNGNGNGMGNSMNMNMNMNMNMSNPNGISGPVQPGPYDIVCGRNSGAYNYIGNRRFRVTIEMNLQRYIDSPTREDKTNVIKSIVWMLHNDVGARFLKKETIKPSKHVLRTHAQRTKMQSQSSDKNATVTARFTIMTGKQAREKVGHALRDLVITERRERQQKQRWL